MSRVDQQWSTLFQLRFELRGDWNMFTWQYSKACTKRILSARFVNERIEVVVGYFRLELRYEPS